MLFFLVSKGYTIYRKKQLTLREISSRKLYLSFFVYCRTKNKIWYYFFYVIWKIIHSIVCFIIIIIICFIFTSNISYLQIDDLNTNFKSICDLLALISFQISKIIFRKISRVNTTLSLKLSTII